MELILFEKYKKPVAVFCCGFCMGMVFGIEEMVYGGRKLFGISWTVDDIGVIDGPGFIKGHCVGLLVMFVGQLVYHQAR